MFISAALINSRVFHNANARAVGLDYVAALHPWYNDRCVDAQLPTHVHRCFLSTHSILNYHAPTNNETTLDYYLIHFRASSIVYPINCIRRWLACDVG